MRKKTTITITAPRKAVRKAVVRSVLKKSVKKAVVKKAPAPAPAPVPTPAPARHKKTQASQPQPVFTIKKTHQNKTSYFIDTLENLSARLRYFIMDPIPAKTGRGRKAEKPEPVQEKTYKTPQELVEALNDTLLRAGSYDVHYEVTDKI